MTHILHITASAHGAASASRRASAQIIEGLAPVAVTHRDVGTAPLPMITGDWADARLIAPADRSAEQADVLALSDVLIAELQAAETVVIAVPLYNFGVPAALKAWMDLVARPGVTFRYGEGGPEGLLKGKKAIVVVSSGGVPVGSEMDHLTPHLRLFLGFIGISDVDVVAAKDV